MRTITQRDAPEIGRGRHIGELAKLARVLAARTGQELIVEQVARDAGIERSALARNYLPLLETVYLSVSLPAWSRNFTSRAVKHAKTYIADPGLAAHLLGVNAAALAAPGSPALGPLVETFVVTELIRQAARLLDPDVTLHHFRTKDQSEVDVIAEAADGRIVAVEAKAGRTVGRSTIRTLASLRDRIDDGGGRFVRGVVLYLGDDALPAGDRLAILPLSHLWRPPAS
ncbi:MAG: ATP-binding protein [Candidatus Dormibacteria bacterium]